MITTIFNTII